MNITISQFELRLLLAIFLGACIGLERQWQRKTAGIKTNALVAMGASLFMLLSEKIMGDSSSASRVAAQIVSGIGFLGAGAIMKEGFNVAGLNTAATIWCSGAIGSLAGMGLAYESFVGTGFIVMANILLRNVSHRVDAKFANADYKYLIELSCSKESLETVKTLIRASLEKVDNKRMYSFSEAEVSPSLFQIKAEIESLTKADDEIKTLSASLKNVETVTIVKWTMLPS